LGYKLRFVQTFDKNNEESFMHWEKMFMELEEKNPGMKAGKRYVPVLGRVATNTLIWEAEYDSLEEATRSLEALGNNEMHNELLKHQVAYMRDAYIELYRAM
jgi:hypothetical protein